MIELKIVHIGDIQLQYHIVNRMCF